MENNEKEWVMSIILFTLLAGVFTLASFANPEIIIVGIIKAVGVLVVVLLVLLGIKKQVGIINGG